MTFNAHGADHGRSISRSVATTATAMRMASSRQRRLQENQEAQRTSGKAGASGSRPRSTPEPK